MSVVAGILMIAGSAIAVLAGIGVLRFSTAYARFHAAGKASPVAFIVAAGGVGLELGWSASALLLVAVLAMSLTLPVGVHLLFQAEHRTTDNSHLLVDDLTEAQRKARESGAG